MACSAQKPLEETTDKSRNDMAESLDKKITSECDLTTSIKRLNIRETTENEAESATGSSSCSQSEYELVDDDKSLKDCLENIKEAVRVDPLIAFDCEGDNLSRKGSILLMSVATHTKAFLIDIKALKSMPFELGLRDILEDESIKKLMFDCREDADALFHHFQVRLDGVLDLQLLDIIKEHFNKEIRPVGRRSDRHGEVYRIKSLLDCITLHLKDKMMQEQKIKGARSLSNWDKRPLEKHQLEYAKTDVLSLFSLFEKLTPDDEEMKRLEIASAKYVDMKRSIVNRTYDRYEKNGYLPIDIVQRKGETTFEAGYTSCTTCKRRFPYDEFSKSQLRKLEQKCRTCKRVKNDHDVQIQREQQCESRDYYYDSPPEYVYYDSDERWHCFGADSDNDYDDYFGYDSDW